MYPKNDSNFSIKNWNESDRPREKLVLKGKKQLTDAELMAILIGSGSRDESAVDLCKRILAQYDNNLNTLSKLNINNLTKFKGIGEAKAISIIASLELGRRQRASIEKQTHINCSQDIFTLIQPILGNLNHEEFWVILLNNANKILHYQMISSGGQTATSVDPRMIFKTALEFSAVAIILVHNHPSGKLTPSRADLQITSKLCEAGKVLDIKVLDHIIITEKDYYSFCDHGNL